MTMCVSISSFTETDKICFHFVIISYFVCNKCVMQQNVEIVKGYKYPIVPMYVSLSSILTIIEARTGPFITHQMAALSFMSQHLRKQKNIHNTYR